MSKVKDLKKRVAAQRLSEANAVKPAPYFVFHCDACGVSRVYNNQKLAPTSVSCSYCAGVCRREWKRPANYDPREGRHR
jgi:hypothetical protein